MKKTHKMKKYTDYSTEVKSGIMTEIELLDSLMSVDKGFQDAVIFMTGTSGSGKTTLAKVIQKNIKHMFTALYERETSAKSVAKQTRRVVIEHSNALISDNTDYPYFMDFMNDVEKRGIKFIIVDSLQTAATDFEQEGMSEKDAQLKVLEVLKNWKDKTGGTAILIGMVNKDGDFSGVNKIKHLADCHIHLNYNKKTNERSLETTKNRDNSTGKLYYEFVDSDEVIIFYSEKEFEFKDKSINFDDYLLNNVVEYINNLDKKHPNYQSCKEECFSKLDKLNDSGSKVGVVIEAIKIIEETIKKYDL